MADTNGAAQKTYLYVTVQEASGKSKDQEVLWEPSFTEGFVRVEVRGGAKTIKATTMVQSVRNLAIIWKQELRVEVTDESKELRIMLCKEKPRDGSGGKRSTAILAACGIFVQDILEAVPIDKYFELFKPGEDRERALGGFIRVTLRTGSVNQLQGQIPAGETQPPPHKTAGLFPEVDAAVATHLSEYAAGSADDKGAGKRGLRRILIVVGVAAAIAVVKIVTSRKH